MNKRKIVIIILNTIFISLLIFSLFNIVKWNYYNKKNKDIKHEINDSIQIIKSEDKKEPDKYVIDFKKLKEKNNDTIAYLKVLNTNINTVVVKGKDNKYYLNHNFLKEYNLAGWLFAHYQNKLDDTDKNIIIFGHNVKDGSMFGTLKNALKKEWYTNKDNREIVLVTEKETIKYEIFSIYKIPKEDYYIQTKFKNNQIYNNFLKTLIKRSIYNFNVDLTDTKQILTLSTCNETGSSRIVIHAKKINTRNNN